MSELVFFVSGWQPLLRILAVGIGMYVALVVVLRVSGSRTLSSLNAFDFIVTVAIGSAFGRALTAKGVALSEALVAFALLIALQFGVAWAQSRWPRLNDVVTNPPTLLYARGAFLQGAMRRSRVSRASVEAAVRLHSVGSMSQVDAVVLESTGELSVVLDLGDASAFSGVIRHQLDALEER